MFVLCIDLITISYLPSAMKNNNFPSGFSSPSRYNQQSFDEEGKYQQYQQQYQQQHSQNQQNQQQKQQHLQQYQQTYQQKYQESQAQYQQHLQTVSLKYVGKQHSPNYDRIVSDSRRHMSASNPESTIAPFAHSDHSVPSDSPKSMIRISCDDNYAYAGKNIQNMNKNDPMNSNVNADLLALHSYSDRLLRDIDNNNSVSMQKRDLKWSDTPEKAASSNLSPNRNNNNNSISKEQYNIRLPDTSNQRSSDKIMEQTLQNEIPSQVDNRSRSTHRDHHYEADYPSSQRANIESIQNIHSDNHPGSTVHMPVDRKSMYPMDILDVLHQTDLRYQNHSSNDGHENAVSRREDSGYPYHPNPNFHSKERESYQHSYSPHQQANRSRQQLREQYSRGAPSNPIANSYPQKHAFNPNSASRIMTSPEVKRNSIDAFSIYEHSNSISSHPVQEGRSKQQSRHQYPSMDLNLTYKNNSHLSNSTPFDNNFRNANHYSSNQISGSRYGPSQGEKNLFSKHGGKSKHNHPFTNGPGANLANINANILAQIDTRTGMIKTPGLPIKTSDLDKGPDGCNLFVFHIPNDMTNLDLYQLFSAFGEVLSAHIMVDKQSGRSRGFGFVSYSSLDAAEEAIRHVNGYVLGHKRLKVEQKKENQGKHNIGDHSMEEMRRRSIYGQKSNHEKTRTNNGNRFPKEIHGNGTEFVTPEQARTMALFKQLERKTTETKYNNLNKVTYGNGGSGEAEDSTFLSSPNTSSGFSNFDLSRTSEISTQINRDFHGPFRINVGGATSGREFPDSTDFQTGRLERNGEEVDKGNLDMKWLRQKLLDTSLTDDGNIPDVNKVINSHNRDNLSSNNQALEQHFPYSPIGEGRGIMMDLTSVSEDPNYTPQKYNNHIEEHQSYHYPSQAEQESSPESLNNESNDNNNDNDMTKGIQSNDANSTKTLEEEGKNSLPGGRTSSPSNNQTFHDSCNTGLEVEKLYNLSSPSSPPSSSTTSEEAEA